MRRFGVAVHREEERRGAEGTSATRDGQPARYHCPQNGACFRRWPTACERSRLLRPSATQCRTPNENVTTYPGYVSYLGEGALYAIFSTMNPGFLILL